MEDGPSLDASSDRARIAQATGMLMELRGLSAPTALALLRAVSWKRLVSTPCVARELVEAWPENSEQI
jgi:AmiR/NasT family two-component response regulator